MSGLLPSEDDDGSQAQIDALRVERDRFRGLLEECRNFLGIVEGAGASRFAAHLSDALNGSRGAS